MSKILIVVVLILIVVVPMYGQNKECILDTAKDGDMIKVHARLLAEGRIQPTACVGGGASSLWLTSEDIKGGSAFWEFYLSKSERDYFRQQGDDRSFDKSMMLPVKQDRVFLEFKRLINETIPWTYVEKQGKSLIEHHCPHCSKYDITADFEGKLVILPYPYPKGMKSGIGSLEGIGNIRVITRYVLILTSILSFEAVELGWLNSLPKDNGADGIGVGPTGKIIRIDSQTETEQ